MDTNTMLREAITTDSRKRKARWQTELEALGYTIYKDKAWIIVNPKTNRRIRLNYDSDYLYATKVNIRFGRVWSYKKGCYVTKPLEKINLERLLNKNKVSDCYWTDSWTSVDRMTRALHDRKYHQTYVDNAWNTFQSELDAITKEYNKKIASAKRSYEWNIKYHTEELKCANDTINQLLKRG